MNLITVHLVWSEQNKYRSGYESLLGCMSWGIDENKKDKKILNKIHYEISSASSLLWFAIIDSLSLSFSSLDNSDNLWLSSEKEERYDYKLFGLSTFLSDLVELKRLNTSIAYRCTYLSLILEC